MSPSPAPNTPPTQARAGLGSVTAEAASDRRMAELCAAAVAKRERAAVEAELGFAQQAAEQLRDELARVESSAAERQASPPARSF